jgi:hypothetical protein
MLRRAEPRGTIRLGRGHSGKRARRMAVAPAPSPPVATRSVVSSPGVRVVALVTALVPMVAILVVLGPYLWPLDRAPASPFSDIHHQHAPMLKLLASELARSGELPRWNVQDFAGTPTIGDPEAGVYNPIYWLLLLKPGVRVFGLLIVAYTLIGAAGFMLYATRLGLSLGAASAGAVAFTLGGKLLLHLVLPGHTPFGSFFLIPFLLWTVERASEGGRPGSVALTVALSALVAVSMHPQLLVYTAAIISVLVVATVCRRPRPARAFLTLATAAALAVALAAVHLLPIFAFAGEFSRARPEFFNRAAWARQAAELYRVRWADLFSGDIFSWETHYYLGGVTLGLTAIGLLAWPRGDWRRRLAWLHGGVGAALLAYGLGAVEPIVVHAPILKMFRLPVRALIPLGLCVAVLVALGVDALTCAPVQRRRRVAGVAIPVTLVILIASKANPASILTFLVAVGSGLVIDRATSEVRGGLPRTKGQAHVPSRGATQTAVLATLLVIVALATDTGRVVTPHVRTLPAAEIGAPPPGVVVPPDLANARRFAELDRGAAMPGLPELFVRQRRLETLAGFNTLIPWRFVVYAAYAAGVDPRTHPVDIAVPLPGYNAKLFDLLGVTHILEQTSVDPDTWDDPETWRWRRSTTAFPRAYLVPGPIIVPEGHADTRVTAELRAMQLLSGIDPTRHVLLHGPPARSALAVVGIESGAALESFRPVAIRTRTANRIELEVDLERPGILVLNEPFFTGWSASDGENEIPLLRANVMFRALVLGAGHHDVTVEFTPRCWRVGWWISLLAAITTAALGLVAVGQLARSRCGRPSHRPRRRCRSSRG